MKKEIYVEFSNDILDFLNSNNIALENILTSRKLNFSVVEKVSPYFDEKAEKSKDVVLVILASSVAIISIAYAISSVLHEVYSRPHKIEIFEDTEIRDKDGNLVFDKHNNVLLKKVKKIEIVKPNKESIENEIDLKMDYKKGISIKFKTLKNDK